MRHVALLLLALFPIQAARAGITTFTSQAAFDLLTPGLATQDFSSANVAAGGSALVTGPLNSATNNAVFSSGDIKPGLSITSSGSSAVGNQIYVAGIGNIANTANAIFTNGSNATMSLGFGPGVSAVGLQLIGFTNNTGARPFNLTVTTNLGPTNLVTDIIPDSGSGKFLGFIAMAGETIQGISFQSGIGANEGLTFVSFGNPSSSVVPEPTSFIILGTLLAPVGLVRRRNA